MWMSTIIGPSPEHEGISEGTLEPLAPDLALKLSKELPSSDTQGLKAKSHCPAGNRPDLPRPEPQQSLATSTSPLSTSRVLSNPQLHSHELSSANTPGMSPSIFSRDPSSELQHIIVRSFAPRVAVYASDDTEDFIRGKGFKDGLHGLIRPYGERLQGKVVIRDSIGGSKAWDDFGVRFVNSKQLRSPGPYYSTFEALDPSPQSQINGSQQISEERSISHGSDSRVVIDQVLDHFLKKENGDRGGLTTGYFDNGNRPYESKSNFSSFYPTYLRKLLSDATLVPYETFSHPVACVIAVSSRHPAPIEALRQLYASTSHGKNQTPVWVGTEFLRYYVLVHDEGNDDITKSTALFDLMKRHFGLHCHLLRLRSSQCVQTDDDSSKVPLCEWFSAEEQMERIRKDGKFETFPNRMKRR